MRDWGKNTEEFSTNAKSWCTSDCYLFTTDLIPYLAVVFMSVFVPPLSKTFMKLFRCPRMMSPQTSLVLNNVFSPLVVETFWSLKPVQANIMMWKLSFPLPCKLQFVKTTACIPSQAKIWQDVKSSPFPAEYLNKIETWSLNSLSVLTRSSQQLGSSSCHSPFRIVTHPFIAGQLSHKIVAVLNLLYFG